MITIPVILITVAGPAGHVDVGVRSDVTPAELAASLGEVLGTSPPWAGGEHRAPPRPGDPSGRRAQLVPDASLADAGVADGDVVVFGNPAGYPAPVATGRRAGPEDGLPGPGGQPGPGARRPGIRGASPEGGRAR
jgi:WXG100 protein secretion system (Wss), protein YukD